MLLDMPAAIACRVTVVEPDGGAGTTKSSRTTRGEPATGAT